MCGRLEESRHRGTVKPRRFSMLGTLTKTPAADRGYPHDLLIKIDRLLSTRIPPYVTN
jgi:hypothetical protein